MEQFPIGHLTETNFLSILYGRRNSGKTYLLLYLLRMIKDRFEVVKLFTNTIETKLAFKPLIGENYIGQGFEDRETTRNIEQMIKFNEGRLAQGRRPIKFLLIFDDVVDTNAAHNAKILDRLATNGRHWGISLFITSQYPHRISPTMRDNADFAFVFKLMNKKTIEELTAMYFDLLKERFRTQSDQAWSMKLNELTADYNALVVETTGGDIRYWRVRAAG